MALVVQQQQHCPLRRAARVPRQPTHVATPRGRARRRVATHAAAPGKDAELCVDLPTADARSCLRLKLVPTGPARQAIVVEAVADGSSVAAAGVQRGMALTAISDPVRRNEVWHLQDRPSLRYVRDALRMRNSPTVELHFTPPSAQLLDALDAGESALQLASSSSSSSKAGGDSAAGSSMSSLASMTLSDEDGDGDAAGGTMAERLAQQFEQKQFEQAASQGAAALGERQQRRKDYMEQVKQRNHTSLVLIVGASVLLPALVILGVAWGSGYMSHLYSNTMSSLR